jgi:hypothetical protein
VNSSAEVFLTSLPNMDHATNARIQAMRARERELNMILTQGQQKLRARVKERKTRIVEERKQTRRHQDALREMVERKKHPRAQREVVTKASKGASAGTKAANKSLQQFLDMRADHKQRTGEQRVFAA